MKEGEILGESIVLKEFEGILFIYLIIQYFCLLLKLYVRFVMNRGCEVRVGF